MFLLTSDIQIRLSDGRTVRVKPEKVTWKKGVRQACDECSVTLPLHPYVRSMREGTDVMTGEGECMFNVGDKVSVKLGYDGRNTERFSGFVGAVNYDDKLQLKCEGYYHLLKEKQ